MSTRKRAESTDPIHDLKVFDTFSKPVYLSIGDPYIADKNTVTASDRYKGRQFGIIPPKKGTHNDATFGKFESLATTGPATREVSPKRSPSPKRHIKPFVPSSPTKKLTGPGDTHGCFNSFEYTSQPYEPNDSTKDAKGRGGRRSASPSSNKKNLPPFRPSNPPKKGLNSTFSPFPEYMVGSSPLDLASSTTPGMMRTREKEKVFKPAGKLSGSTPTPSIAALAATRR